MCGIVGVAGASSKANDNILQTLLTLDGLRGTDSTGIAAITNKNDAVIVKAIGNPYELFANRGYDAAVGGTNRAVIGHNRFATQGGVNKANAHPFDFDTIVGVHNGTLTNKWELEDNKNFVVDSENLYHHMEKKGLHHLMGVMKGAWSLVWWDKVNETLNFLRNKERPMHITWSDDWKSMYWASEAWMLDVATARYGVKRTEIQATVPDTMYAFQIDEKRVVYKAVEEHHPSRAPVFIAPSSGSTNTNGSNVLALGGKDTSKKPGPGKAVVTTSNGYSGKKNVVLEVLALCTDRYGAEYYVCFDKEVPEQAVRMYKHRGDADFKMGVEIMADLNMCTYSEPETDQHKASSYCKVMNTSVIALEENAITDKHTEYFLDPKGHKKTAEDWYQDHGTCDQCGAFCDPAQNFRFTMTGSSICHDCVADPSVSKFISYAK